MGRGWVLVVGSLLCAAGTAQEEGGVGTRQRVGRLDMTAVVLDSPSPTAHGRFGQSCVLLDFDGDGNLDVAIGASGEERAYVALGAAPGASYRFRAMKVLAPAPTGPDHESSGSFAAFMAAGNLDGDAADELVVGEPEVDGRIGAVHVFGLGAPGAPPLRWTPELADEGGAFGWSVAVGDFDGDGVGDLAVAACDARLDGVAAGRVEIFFGPLAAPETGGAAAGSGGSESSSTPPVHEPRHLVLENPFPAEHGGFGHDLAALDVDDDGVDDLVVAAPGNTSQGVPLAGQVFVFTGPPEAGRAIVLEDPDPDPDDPSRFGMDIAAYRQVVTVGSPRKNTATLDAGLGFVFRHPGAGPLTMHQQPQAVPNDILGFRTAVADVAGGSRPDALFVSLQKKSVYVWDGTRLTDPPLRVRMLADSADHFAQSMTTGQIFPGAREELLLGDPTWDRPGKGKKDNAGRLVIYYLPAAK